MKEKIANCQTISFQLHVKETTKKSSWRIFTVEETVYSLRKPLIKYHSPFST